MAIAIAAASAFEAAFSPRSNRFDLTASRRSAALNLLKQAEPPLLHADGTLKTAGREVPIHSHRSFAATNEQRGAKRSSKAGAGARILERWRPPLISGECADDRNTGSTQAIPETRTRPPLRNFLSTEAAGWSGGITGEKQ